MHDQEPLNFNYYKNLDLEDIWSHMRKNHASRITRLEKHGQIDRMIEIHKSNNLDIFNGNYLADCWLLCHSEKKSQDLVKYESLGAIGIYWWSHALIARDWYRYAQIDQRLIYSAMDFDKDFNVYNRAWTGTREYRLKFAEMCVKNDLLPFTSIKVSTKDSGHDYRDHVFKNPRFDLKSDISMLCSTQPSSDSSADYNYEDYQKIAIDVVLETLFDDERLHLTEKILRPIACGKPFILVSTPGSLQYLRDYGIHRRKL